MKILFDNYIFEVQKAGGISKVWFNILKRIPVNIDPYFIEGDVSKNLFRKELNLNANNVIKLEKKFSSFNQYLKIPNSNFDIFHSSYFRPIKNKGNSKVIVTVHDFIYEKYGTYLAKKNHLFIKNRSLKQADEVICVSNHTKKDFLKFYPQFNPNNVHVVYNGVDEEFKKIEIKENIKINDSFLKINNYLLYVGSRGYCKNFKFIINLMSSKIVKDNGFKLVCVGGGEFSKNEIKHFKEKGIYGEITHLDKVENKDLNILYNHAFCLLFPSIYEGFGIPALEAISVGCPVWSTKSSSVIEIIGENYPIKFSPDNWKEALNSFELLLNNEKRDLAKQIGLENATKFSWDRCAKETFNVYDKCLV